MIEVGLVTAVVETVFVAGLFVDDPYFDSLYLLVWDRVDLVGNLDSCEVVAEH